MVDGVEGSGQVKQAERGDVSVVGSEQKAVIDLLMFAVLRRIDELGGRYDPSTVKRRDRERGEGVNKTQEAKFSVSG